MKKHLVSSFVLFAFLVIGMAGAGMVSAAEQFPAKTIEIWIGYGAGGSTDVPARALAEATSQIIGQPVVAVNMPGGGSAVMLGQLKSKKPDGYTLGILSSGGLLSAHLRKVPYHPVNDFDAIMQYSVYSYAIAVKAESPLNNINDLVAYAKANPGKFKYSTAGVGTPQHLAMMMLEEVANVKMIHIPFGSGNEAVTAVLGGHVDATAQTSEWKPQVEAGRLKLIANMMDKRMESYPNVPTLKESGYDISTPSIIAIIAPKGIPAETKKILHDAFYKATQDQRFRNSLKQFDIPLVYRNTADTEKYINEFWTNTEAMCKKVIQKK